MLYPVTDKMKPDLSSFCITECCTELQHQGAMYEPTRYAAAKDCTAARHAEQSHRADTKSKHYGLIWWCLSVDLVLSGLTSERSPEESQTEISFDVSVIRSRSPWRLLEHLACLGTTVLSLNNPSSKITRCLYSQKEEHYS